MTRFKKKLSDSEKDTIKDFGQEWSQYDQSELSDQERKEIFDKYFSLFPWDSLPKESIGFDLGCGSGRWAMLAAPKVGTLHCIDPSSAIKVAEQNLSYLSNCVFHNESVDSMSLEDNSMDFGYSLGVLHHISNPLEGLNNCVNKLKPGAPFLVYLYYALENRPTWYRAIWYISNFFRRSISKLPFKLRNFISQIIALFIYWPLARFANLMDRLHFNVNSLPLSEYRTKSFYTMLTDALDRFGTKIEHRFTAEEIQEMMMRSGLENISFSKSAPYWCAIGYKKIISL